MIFITLGTHEQPFNRLIKEINHLVKDNIIQEEVFMQAGYINEVAPSVPHERFISSAEMDVYLKKARVIIVHGGLGSIVRALNNKKIPIVVPRQKKFGEHVDDHQVIFSSKLSMEKKIIAVLDIRELGGKILNYESELTRLGMSENREKDFKKRADIFAGKLDKICQDLVRKP
jgi:UDP-N-acetylglucosamine transferase subunit ALG13